MKLLTVRFYNPATGEERVTEMLKVNSSGEAIRIGREQLGTKGWQVFAVSNYDHLLD
jgi:hypothetical protein